MMLTDTQRMIQSTARDFARKRLIPGAAKRDEEALFPTEEIAEMGQLGLMGMLIPEIWGGVEADYVSMALAIEEIAAGDGAISTIMSVQNSLVTAGILRFGNDDQKERFLKPLAGGNMLGAFALSEPQAGSDAAALLCTAKREGDDYLINGTKQFITSGKHADETWSCRYSAPKGKKGVSAFIVPTNSKGYNVAKLEDKMGQKSSDTAQLVFHHLRVPSANRLGEEGEGYTIALANLEGGRIRHRRAIYRHGSRRARHRAALCQRPSGFRQTHSSSSSCGISFGGYGDRNRSCALSFASCRAIA